MAVKVLSVPHGAMGWSVVCDFGMSGSRNFRRGGGGGGDPGQSDKL